MVDETGFLGRDSLKVAGRLLSRRLGGSISHARIRRIDACCYAALPEVVHQHQIPPRTLIGAIEKCFAIGGNADTAAKAQAAPKTMQLAYVLRRKVIELDGGVARRDLWRRGCAPVPVPGPLSENQTPLGGISDGPRNEAQLPSSDRRRQEGASQPSLGLGGRSRRTTMSSACSIPDGSLRDPAVDRGL
jgi:hypothetical protein